MIGFGLTMMGGCFAQDESGAAVDTYWVADRHHLDSGVSNTTVAAAEFSGGDSATDAMECTLQADGYYSAYHICSLFSPEGGNRKGQVIFSGSSGIHVLGQQNGNTSAWSEVLKERFTWWMRGGKYKRGGEVGDLYVYNLENSEPRLFRIGSALKGNNRIIYNVNYCNERTRWRLQWQPMRSLSGTAFFEPTTATLAEQ